jgi:hypothetical protein
MRGFSMLLLLMMIALCHGSFQDGYNQGVHDWNIFSSDLSHHFICPFNDKSGFCQGYDAALRFETSDQ